MLVSKKTHRLTRLQNYLFLLLLAGVVAALAWLSTRYHVEADWTSAGRNSLSPESSALLEGMPDPISITSYATEDQNLRRSISGLIARYQRQKADVRLSFVNPDLAPDTVRQLGITSNGELVLEYQGRRENLKNLSEQSLTNALQRLARGGERWLVFLSGHGERNPQGDANHDFGNWGQQLAAKGFKAQVHNLAGHAQLPDNTTVLVVASPQVALLHGELSAIRHYIEQGGNLLWLLDPDSRFGLEMLKETLGISALRGVVVDPNTQLLGISDPRFALVGDYPQHNINLNLDSISLFPQAVGLQSATREGWESEAFLLSHERSWSENGALSGSIRFDAGVDNAGPLTLGYALNRLLPAGAGQPARLQRIVILGDGDFLSNAYLGNGGNLNLGMNIVNWLSHDDRFIDIPLKMAPDHELQLTPGTQIAITAGFLLVIPLGLAVAGFVIWWRRRKR